MIIIISIFIRVLTPTKDQSTSCFDKSSALNILSNLNNDFVRTFYFRTDFQHFQSFRKSSRFVPSALTIMGTTVTFIFQNLFHPTGKVLIFIQYFCLLVSVNILPKISYHLLYSRIFFFLSRVTSGRGSSDSKSLLWRILFIVLNHKSTSSLLITPGRFCLIWFLCLMVY